MSTPRLVCALSVLALLVSCKSSSSSAKPDTEGGWQSEFDVRPGELASRGTNPYFVLEPGFQLTLASPDKHKQLVITVLDETATIDGVETRVVEERETRDDQPIEISRNYFAISTRTNDVFYFGEDVDIYKNGRVVDHEGAWRSGVHGARFGLMMPGALEVGRRYQQEIAPHVAMDRFEVKSTDATYETPAGRFDHCLEVEESNALEPGDHEGKHYARGIGLIQDENLKLVAYGPRSQRR